jgi:hypothetical protein
LFLAAPPGRSTRLKRRPPQSCEVTDHPVSARGQRQHPRFVQGVLPVQPGPPGQRQYLGELALSESDQANPPGQRRL